MRMQSPPRRKPEPTIALINVVFLMLIFFMVAGSLAPPLSRDVTLVETRDLEGRAPPDALVILPDGTLNYRGDVLPDAAAFVAALPEEERETVRIVPDRALDALDLVELTQELVAAGAGRVMAVTERGLE